MKKYLTLRVSVGGSGLAGTGGSGTGSGMFGVSATGWTGALHLLDDKQ